MRKTSSKRGLTSSCDLDILHGIGGIFVRERKLSEGVESSVVDGIMHISRRLLQRGARMLESQGIGVGQVPILKLLGENGTMTQRQIAEEIRVTPATICGTIKRMERAGLIRRAPAEWDGRVTCISLTEEGALRGEQAWNIFEKAHSEMLRGFSEEEERQLQDFVRRMGENLQRAMDSAEEG